MFSHVSFTLKTVPLSLKWHHLNVMVTTTTQRQTLVKFMCWNPSAGNQPTKSTAASDLDMNAVQSRKHTLQAHTDRVWSIDWSPDGQVLASAGGDKVIRIWRRGIDGTWECIAILDGLHMRTIRCVRWSPDASMLASCGFDGVIGIWRRSEDSGDYECISNLEGHENEVKCVAWAPCGSLLATCGRDKTVWIWELVDGLDWECVGVCYGHSQDVKYVTWHPTHQVLFSCSYDDTIKVWDEEDVDWYCANTLTAHESTVWAIDFNSKGDSFVSCSDDRSVRIWAQQGDSLLHWMVISVLEDVHSRPIYSLSWSRANCVATAGGDDAVCLLDPDSKEILSKLDNAHDGDINCVRWNPRDPRLLASSSDDCTVIVWNLESINGAVTR